jgi:hypothetical protein
MAGATTWEAVRGFVDEISRTASHVHVEATASTTRTHIATSTDMDVDEHEVAAVGWGAPAAAGGGGLDDWAAPVVREGELAVLSAKKFSVVNNRIGGLPDDWTMSTYESWFGKVVDDTTDSPYPFGVDVWKGMVRFFYEQYARDNVGRYNLAWCRDRRSVIPWLGCVLMKPDWSKEATRQPSDDVRNQELHAPSLYVYPAIVLLDLNQNELAKRSLAMAKKQTPTCPLPPILQGRTASVHTPVANAINLVYLNSTQFNEVQVVWMKVLVCCLKPWACHLDHVHLYCPVPDTL